MDEGDRVHRFGPHHVGYRLLLHCLVALQQAAITLHVEHHTKSDFSTETGESE